MPHALKLQLHIFVPFNYGYSMLYADLQSFAIIRNTYTWILHQFLRIPFFANNSPILKYVVRKIADDSRQ